jgi:hypothetical protein
MAVDINTTTNANTSVSFIIDTSSSVCCFRPANLVNYGVTTGYRLVSGGPLINFTSSLADATAARALMSSVASTSGFIKSLLNPPSVNQYVYSGFTSDTRCFNSMPGTYFVLMQLVGTPVSSSDPIVQIVNSVIVAVYV